MKKSQKTKEKPEKDSELPANDSGAQDSQVSSYFNNGLSAEDLNVIFEYAPDAYYLFDLMGYFVDGNLMIENISKDER